MISVFCFQEPNPLNMWTIVGGFLGSAALGSIISLIGVWLQNKGQAKQQRVAREMEMRRDIYFLGAEALGKMQSYLISLANPLMPDDKRDQIVHGVDESLNKVAIIASLEMLTDLDKVQAHYSSITTSLITERLEFTSRASQLKNDEDAHANLGQHLAQITAALNAANQQHDQREQTALIARYNELDALYQRQETDLRSRRADTLVGIQELIGNAIEAALKFDELAAPLNCLVRDELGFPIDKDKYMAMLSAAGVRQRGLAEKWKEDWHNRFEERAKDSPFDANL